MQDCFAALIVDYGVLQCVHRVEGQVQEGMGLRHFPVLRMRILFVCNALADCSIGIDGGRVKQKREIERAVCLDQCVERYIVVFGLGVLCETEVVVRAVVLGENDPLTGNSFLLGPCFVSPNGEFMCEAAVPPVGRGIPLLIGIYLEAKRIKSRALFKFNSPMIDQILEKKPGIKEMCFPEALQRKMLERLFTLHTAIGTPNTF